MNKQPLSTFRLKSIFLFSLLAITFLHPINIGATTKHIDNNYFVTDCENNILENPSFEDGLNNWTITGEAAASSEAYTGNGAATICGGSGSVTKAVATTPGTSYNASVWVKWSELGTYGIVSLRFLDSSYSPISGSGDQANGFSYLDYTQVELSAEAPANAAYVHLYIYKTPLGCLLIDDAELCESTINDPCNPDDTQPNFTYCPSDINRTTSGDGENVFWDSPELEDFCGDSGFSSDYNSGDFFPIGTTTVEYTGIDEVGNIATCSFNVTVNMSLPSGCANNLLINSGFEDSNTDLLGWNAGNLLDNSISNDAYEGNNALLMGGTGYNKVYQLLTVVPGDVITAKAHIKGEDDNFIFRLRFFDANYNQRSTYQTSLMNNPDYEEVMITGTAGANAAFVRVTILKINSSKRVWVDNICATKNGVDPCTPDTTPPSFTSCPSDIEITTSSNGENVSWDSPEVEDLCGAADFSASYNSGDFFSIGTTTVDYTAIDIAGNLSYCSFDITITAEENNECEGSLLVNGDFENSNTEISNWDLESPAAFSISDDAYSGNNAVLIDGTSYSKLKQYFDVSPGTTLILSAQAKASSSSNAFIRMRFFNDNGNQISGFQKNIPASSEYMSVSLEAVAPVNVSYVRVTVLKTTSPGALLVDDLCLVTDAPRGICENSVIENGGFESTTATEDWSTDGDVSVSDNAHSGDQAILMNGPESARISQNFLAEPGKRYTYSAYANLAGDLIVEASIRLAFYNESWQPVGFYASKIITQKSDYQFYTTTGEAPEDAYYVVAFAIKEAGIGQLLVDDFCLTIEDAIDPCDPSVNYAIFNYCQSDITIYTYEDSAPAYFGSGYRSCGGASISYSHPWGSEFPIGTTEVSTVLTSSSGLTTTCTFNLTVVQIDEPDCNANLLVNPDFENQLSGWTYENNEAIASTDAYAGTYAAQLENSDGATISQTILAEAGEKFIASAVVEQQSSLVPPMGLVIYFLDGQENILEIHKTVWKNGTTDYFDYGTLLISATAPENTAFIKIAAQKGKGGGRFNVDDFCLSKEGIVGNSYPVDCEISSDSPWQEWISNVSINGINNSSSKSYYSDFTNIGSTFLAPGESASIEIDASFSYFAEDQYFSIYLDYNGDGNFDSNEVTNASLTNLTSGNGIVHTLTAQIDVPFDAFGSSVKMRVIMQKEEYADTPCGTISFGEVEDYLVTFLPFPATVRTAEAFNEPLRLFPNPAQEQVSIDIEEFLSENIEVEIVNSFGKRMYNKEILTVGRSYEKIDLSGWKNGYYTIWLKPEFGKRRVAKFVVLQTY